MKKLLMTAVTALTLATTTALAAPQTYAMDDSGQEYSALQTESSWMAVEVPLAALGGSVPSDLSIAVSGLPAGTTVTLDSVDTMAQTALLYVTVARSDTTSNVNAVADIAVKSGSTVLTTVSIPVYGAAYN
ncbi:hypothetical protein [uncultured Deinococcus sp.]|uniref:hypothetical protein n=1 Tax=uncultured Deinococcus sp. TaxID=158789 RepID=UPI0025D6ED21|nr:hypothetical protein [uncultured Deinococcus sp.]